MALLLLTRAPDLIHLAAGLVVLAATHSLARKALVDLEVPEALAQTSISKICSLHSVAQEHEEGGEVVVLSKKKF